MSAIFALALLLGGAAHAQQRSFHVDKGDEVWSFDVRWRDAQGAGQRVRFALPADEVRADLDTPLRFRKADANRYVAAELRAWAATRRGPKITARAEGGGVRIGVKGKHRKKVKAAMAAAVAVRDEARERYVREHGFTTIDGAVLPDHIRHVREYADDLAPVVEGLGGPGQSPRAFAERALGMVESIPYEQVASGRDRYRRPLSVLGRNRGDCDSKSTLFLALVHEAWPEVPVELVYVPGHALVGLGIEPLDGEATLEGDGLEWVLAEPVGPRVARLGEVSRKHRRQARRRGEVRALVP